MLAVQDVRLQLQLPHLLIAAMLTPLELQAEANPSFYKVPWPWCFTTAEEK